MAGMKKIGVTREWVEASKVKCSIKSTNSLSVFHIHIGTTKPSETTDLYYAEALNKVITLDWGTPTWLRLDGNNVRTSENVIVTE